jgi:hypothetical protein
MGDWIGRELRVSYAIPNDAPCDDRGPALKQKRRAAAVMVIAASAFAGACQRQPQAKPSPPPASMSVTPITPPSPSPLPDPLPAVVATVDGRPIPLSHARIIAEQALSGVALPTPGQRATAYRRAVEQLITRDLLYAEARARKITPDEAAVERVRKSVRSEHKDEKAWRDFLASQGLDPKSFLEELRIRNVVERMVKQQAESVPEAIPESEARAYYAGNPNLFESAGRPLPFEDVRERINTQLVTFKRQEALNALLVRLRSAAKVETFL